MIQPNFTGAIWRKSTASGDGMSCVEVVQTDGWIGVRDSKDMDGPILVISERGWQAFLAGVGAGSLSPQ